MRKLYDDCKTEELFCPESVDLGASNSFDKLGYHIVKSLVQVRLRGANISGESYGQDMLGYTLVHL